MVASFSLALVEGLSVQQSDVEYNATPEATGFPMAAKRVTDLIAPDRFDAVLFDLDGVLTSTARIHSRCWKGDVR